MQPKHTILFKHNILFLIFYYIHKNKILFPVFIYHLEIFSEQYFSIFLKIPGCVLVFHKYFRRACLRTFLEIHGNLQLVASFYKLMMVRVWFISLIRACDTFPKLLK